MNKNDLAIDLYHLDEKWMELPQLTEDWNSKAVEADIEAMEAKNALDLFKAQMDLSIRENPTEFGLSKLTEATIAAAIADNPAVKEMSEKYFQLLAHHKRVKSYCNSVSTVEKSLNGLTKLYEAGYFASKPICAMASTIAQEKETAKLNTSTNKAKLNKAKK